jgi:hypothetical protein
MQNIGRGAIVLLVGYPLLLAGGQILFKRTAAQLVGLPSLSSFSHSWSSRHSTPHAWSMLLRLSYGSGC